MAESQTTCRICLKPLNEYSMGEKNDYRLAACRACGSVMAQPWPTSADLEKFYGDIQPTIVHLPDPNGAIAGMKKLIQKVVPDCAGRRFLDVSCRQGYAVMAAKALGFQQVKGIDSHEFYISFAKEKYPASLFEHASVHEYAAKGEMAEVIFSIESLCEQPDLEGHVAALAKLIAPGGMLYLQEPDGNSFHLPRNFSRWAFVYPPMNFAYISEKGMTALLARHGLKVQKKLFTWAPFMRWIVVKK